MLQHLAQQRNGWSDLPGVIAFGCSLGATHAVNLYLRRPDILLRWSCTLAHLTLLTSRLAYDIGRSVYWDPTGTPLKLRT